MVDSSTGNINSESSGSSLSNFVASGNISEIKTQLMHYKFISEFFKNIDLSSEGGSEKIYIGPEFGDYLQLTLHWRGVTETTQKNHTVEKSIRLKNLNTKTITLEALQTLGKTVLAKFDNLNFKTGHVKVKYTNWKDGFQTWGYFDAKETGYRIIESMGDIVNKTINRELLKYEYVDDSSAFDSTPTKVSVAGKLVRPRARAPIADMHFYAATILFPWVGHREQLCNISGYILRNLNFLDAYDD